MPSRFFVPPAGSNQTVRLEYRSGLGPDTTEGEFLDALATRREDEIRRRLTLVGPHRDDLEFLVNGVNMLTYGSRGQQRTTALSAKLAELSYMRAHTGDEPILLLDDVFSELDHLRREYLLRQIMQHDQVLLTATDLASFPAEIVQQAHIYRVKDGTILAE